MSPDLHVIAVGARTPVGLRAESAAAAVRAGISRVQYHPFFFDKAVEPVRVAYDARLDIELPVWQRMAALASSAIAEVVAKVARLIPPAERLQVLLSLPETRPGFAEADTRKVTQAILQQALRLPCPIAVEVVGRGHAGPLQALQVASARLAKDHRTLFLVCGTESYLEYETIMWLEGERQLIQEGNRGGFTPGEAAGALLVASEVRVRNLQMTSLARVKGVATAMEPRRIKGDVECLGEGLTAAISGAVAPLRLPDKGIDMVFCDINGERYRTEEWGFAFLRMQRAFKTTDYKLSTDCWGDVGAATGALGCVLAVQSWQRKYADGPRALVCAGSEGGLRGAAVLEQPGA